MRILFLLNILFTLSFSSFGQMTISTQKHDFGDLQSYDVSFIDIVVTNKGPKDGYILSVRKPSEVIYIQNRAFILKDSSLVLRFQVNPRQKGKFHYTVDIITSDRAEPHKLVLSGNLLEMETNSNAYLTQCPDFSSHPIGRKANQFDLTVITIDQETREEIAQTKVSLIQDGVGVWSENTDGNGRIKKSGTIGLAYFYAKHVDYLPSEKGAFVSNERNKIVIELQKKPVQTIVIEDQPVITQERITEEVIIEIGEEKPNEEVVSTPIQETTTIVSLEELEPDNFESSFFEPINVVFVLDVSSSMNQGARLELMKYSLNQLTDMIRQEDKISLVTYASQAKVLLPPTSGAEKELVHEEVKKVRVGGMTAGGEGIRLGYEQVLKGFIENGVNHVFIITDGAFNQQTYNYKKLIKKYTKKNIQLSVVGIQNDARSEQSMREIALLGKGEYIPVFQLIDAQNNIRQAVRKMAFKK